MEIKVTSTSQPKNFVGTNDRAQHTDLSGDLSSASPMEALLMACAGCTAIDVESLLQKMRQSFDKIEIIATGTRADTVPKIFTAIHLHYTIFGNASLDKVAKAIEMSLTQYCSVSLMIKKSVPFTYSFEVLSSKE